MLSSPDALPSFDQAFDILIDSLISGGSGRESRIFKADLGVKRL